MGNDRRSSTVDSDSHECQIQGALETYLFILRDLTILCIMYAEYMIIRYNIDLWGISWRQFIGCNLIAAVIAVIRWAADMLGMKYYGRCMVRIDNENGRASWYAIFGISLIVLYYVIREALGLSRHLKGLASAIATPVVGTYQGASHIYAHYYEHLAFVKISAYGLTLIVLRFLLQVFWSLDYSTLHLLGEEEDAKLSFLTDAFTNFFFACLVAYLFFGGLSRGERKWTREVLKQIGCCCLIGCCYHKLKEGCDDAISDEDVKQATAWDEELQSKLRKIVPASSAQKYGRSRGGMAASMNAGLVTELRSPTGADLLSPGVALPANVHIDMDADSGFTVNPLGGRERSPSNMDMEDATLLVEVD